MRNPAVIDGPRLLSWARRAVRELKAHREEINSLNVFPVPDSDTGSNMAHTMSAALEKAESLGEDTGAAEIASALAVGSVKGARGNSGVVLSQVLRGVAQAAAEGDLDGSSVADALNNAVSYVERAIKDPVEGTIVTVLREAAAAASDELSRPDGAALVDVTAAAVSAAEEALAATPSQLPELRAAGVVDAGGRGLVLLLTALRDEVAGGAEPQTNSEIQVDNPSSLADTRSHGHAGWLEIMFMFSGAVDDLEGVLAPLGTSLIIARASENQAMVHIHSREAGSVIERAYSMGEVSDLRLEILPEPAQENVAERAGRVLAAVSPSDSVAELFRQAGAVAVRPGDNLAEDIRGQLCAAGAGELLLLPNGHVGAAEMEQITRAVRESGADVAVLSTQRLVGGIAALAVYDPRLTLEAAAAQMDEAAADMRTADLVDVPEERIAVVGPDGSALGEGESVQSVVDKACRAMLADGGELVTLLLDDDAAAEVDPAVLEDALGAEVLVYPAGGLGSVGVRGQIGVE